MIFYHAGLAPYLVKSATTIRKWILKEFQRQKLAIKDELANARSRIHISADLWTSPNSLAIVGIVVHYLDKNFKVQNHLIGMRRVHGAHSGKNIAEAMIPCFKISILLLVSGIILGITKVPTIPACEQSAESFAQISKTLMLGV